MIWLREDGPGSRKAYRTSAYGRVMVRNVYRRLRQRLDADQARDAVVRVAIALGEVAE